MFSATSNSLIIFHIIAHLAFIYGVFLSLTGAESDWIGSFLIFLVLSSFGGTVTYHRLLSHRSFKTWKFFEMSGSLIGSIGGNGSPLGWVAIHREHHRYTDTDKDPHSPNHSGFLTVQFLSMLHKPNLRFVPDLRKDKFQILLHKYYWIFNAIIIVGIFYFFNTFGLLFYYFIPALLVWHAGSLINTLNHWPGHSTNNIVTGFLVSGEGWHNNHHNDPANPKFGLKWWEFDLGYLIIKCIQK